MVREDPPDLLVLSTTMTFNVPALRQAVDGTRMAVGDRLHLATGGHALDWAPALRSQLGVEIAGADVVAMVAAARRVLLGVESP
jgi:hypothetical protein